MNSTKALNVLKDHGYKHTKQRKKLLDLFDQYDAYVSVKDLFEVFRLDFPGASYDTVYRNLYTLAEIGILETTTLDGEKHFRFHCDTHGHHHHFICTSCGKTSPINLCPVEDVVSTLPGHQIENHKFEVYGKCPSCV
ncbi:MULTISPECIES: Fur family transcriptional regulator [Pontibacillus]|uniref:Fur family transcriptional regulator n=1 Tax=Pontibacillus chungwhensis TaxID=265426 RepID=A0ABY8V245_9BACI|nr:MULTISPECIES: Fur family transcriptional regulator [Pontibacillus]MCD5322409.1 transcriptional repressor [Pontibacillus sp. HN14]WIF99695.1 Fur family transcriptional regulator [Pontibacillus chungwhensis]